MHAHTHKHNSVVCVYRMACLGELLTLVSARVSLKVISKWKEEKQTGLLHLKQMMKIKLLMLPLMEKYGLIDPCSLTHPHTRAGWV